MTPPQRILLFTNSEYGQANVMLALAYELALRPNVEVHIASFNPLKLRISELQATLASIGSTTVLVFHLVAGLSLDETHARNNPGKSGLPHPGGVKGAIISYQRLPYVMALWSGPEYMESYASCKEIIGSVNPSAIVVNYFFHQCIDACRNLQIKFIILTPGATKDIIGRIQPWFSFFWKYPAPSTGFPYPLPWSYIPINAYLTYRMIRYMNYSPKVIDLQKYRRPADNNLHPTLGMFEAYLPDAHYLSPSTPATDFPLIFPDSVTLCGPILLPALPIEQSDPELANWLDQAPTALVNLGTHAKSDEHFVQEMATGMRVLLDQDTHVQVLWKIKAKGEIQAPLRDILGKEIDSGRVKIVDWLATEPLAVLRHRNVVCSVHHGGANSFFEAVSTGVPQIVLAMWYDTYEYGARVQWLEIGIFANAGIAPSVKGQEFGKALTTIVGDGDRALTYQVTAKALSQRSGKYRGRVTACEKILELAGEP